MHLGEQAGVGDAVGGWPVPLTPTGDTTGTVIAVGVSRADQRGFSGIIPRQAPERVHSARLCPCPCGKRAKAEMPPNSPWRYLFATWVSWRIEGDTPNLLKIMVPAAGIEPATS